MKRLSMAALLIIALSTGAFAHQGSIGLYTDVTATDCDTDFIPFNPFSIEIVYFKSDSGPDGIFAAEFKVEVPEGVMVIQSFEPSPGMLPMGDINTGIACAYDACAGIGSDYTSIGTITVLLTSAMPVPVQIRVLQSDNLTYPPFAPIVAMCNDPERTIVGVLGGWFTSPDGSCDLGTEETTWGGIKEMYKD